MATGFSFADDPQMSVREKIDRYFQKKKTTTMHSAHVLDESTSDESLNNSFARLVRISSFSLKYFSFYVRIGIELCKSQWGVIVDLVKCGTF